MRQWNRGWGCRWDGTRGPYARPYVNEAVGAQGAAYVGPCRCGRGPNAYYRTGDGRIVHALDAPTSTTRFHEDMDVAAMRGEMSRLIEEIKELQRKLAEE